MRWQAGAALVVVLFVLRLVRSGLGHCRVASTMRRLSVSGSVDGVAVRWLPSTGLVAVAGLTRPTIFCDPEVLSRLTGVERRAVVLHEVAHQRRRDPVRLMLLSAVSPMVAWMPPGRAWVERRQADMEIRADQHAMGAGVSATALASALLRVGGPSQLSDMAAFNGALDLRVSALLGDAPTRSPRSGWLLGVVCGVAVVCAGMLIVDGHGLVDGLACVAGWCRP